MKKKIKIFLSKALAFIYVFIKHKLRDRCRISNKKILVIITGHLGNALMDINAVLELAKIFPETEGWKLNLLCSKRIWNICNMVADMTDFHFIDINYIDINSGTDFLTVYRILKQLGNSNYEKIIVTNASIAPLASYIVATVPHAESITVFDEECKRKKGIRWYFNRSYTSKIYVPIDMHETDRLRKIVHHLGGKEYKIRIHPIPQLCEFKIPCDRYITIAIDSLSTERRWPEKYFAELANFLIKETDYKICFTGGEAGEHIYEEIQKKIRNRKRISNYVMKTTFEEWVELIRNASYHIGVDSGSIHVAASVGTKAFSISGVWDSTRCLPYVTEEVTGQTLDPICIYRDNANQLSCYACKIKFGRMGIGNKECYQECQKGNPCICLSAICAEKVMEVIRMEISKEK